MRKFLFRLKIRGTERVFKEGLGPGVIAVQTVAFADVEPYSGATAVALLREEDLFIQRFIEVQIKGIANGSDS